MARRIPKMETTAVNNESGSFESFLKKVKDQVKDQQSENYYPTNVVIDAYKLGMQNGLDQGQGSKLEDIFKKDIDQSLKSAVFAYIITSSVVEKLKKQSYNVLKLLLRVKDGNPEIFLAVKKELLIDEKFLDLGYELIFDCIKQFDSKFDKTFDLTFIQSDNLDYSLLEQDGYKVIEDYENK